MFGQNTDLKHEIKITVGGAPLEIDHVDGIEFSFGDLKKYYPGNDVKYDDDTGKFYVHLTQEETLKFGRSLAVQVRVKFINGNVILTCKKTVSVEESLSKELLK